jgi:ribosomal protein S17E
MAKNRDDFQDLKITNVPKNLLREVQNIAKNELGQTTSGYLTSKIKQIVREHRERGA